MASTSKEVDLSSYYERSRPKKPPCQIGLILAGKGTPKLSPAERANLKAAIGEIDDGLVTAPGIVQTLQECHKIKTNSVRVSNHKRGACSCAKS